MSKFKILLVVLFAALVNINFSYAQIWSAITGNNTLNINGASVGIGTTTQTKKFEIWDGTTPGKFTFSVPSCTTSYEVSQTLDDTGYKLNVLSSARNYKVAINGTDRFKLLSNDNVGLGTNSLSSITSASNNIGIGANSLKSTTSGVYNIAIGTSTLNSVINGSHNIAIGANSLYNTTTGIYNIAIGSMAMSINNTGSFNSALGCSAGQLYSNNMYSVYLGAYSKSQADNQTNQIVIGYNAIGNGSNTVTLGNDNITGTILKGNVGIGTATPTQALNVVGRIGVSPSGTRSDEGYNGGLMITKPIASGQYINLVRSGIVPWSIGTVYNSSTFAIGLGKSPDDKFTNPFFNIDTNGNLGVGTTTPNAKIESVSGVNAFPAVTGTIQSGSALRLRGGDNAVLDFGMNSINTWIQATDQNNLGLNYNISLNPNGGNVAIGTKTASEKLTVAGGHTDTKIRLSSTGNGSDQPANLSLWASEPGVTYYGTGIGYNVNGSPYYGRLDNTRGSSYIRFLPGETKFQFQNTAGSNIDALTIKENGFVGIGIGSGIPDQLLTVNGTIHAKEIIVTVDVPSDFVFNTSYKLMPLNEVEKYVTTNSHLPEIPSAAEIKKNGLSMGEMQNKLLQKVEELTLYMIDQQKIINMQSAQISQQNTKIENLEKKLK